MSFSRETTVKAVRKRHRCDICFKMIDIGEPAARWSGMADGDFASAIMHTDCREAEVAFNREHGTVYADEWQPISDLDEDDHRDWLVEHWPAVAARIGIIALGDPA